MRVKLFFAVLVVLFAGAPQSESIAGPVGGTGQVRYGTSQRKGFDTCAAPSTGVMQSWWTYSPYYDTVIYMGGLDTCLPAA